jgi:hypothetical protein
MFRYYNCYPHMASAAPVYSREGKMSSTMNVPGQLDATYLSLIAGSPQNRPIGLYDCCVRPA